MDAQYSPDHIQSALNHIHNNWEDLQEEVLKLSPNVTLDTEILKLKEFICFDDNSDAVSSIKTLASELVKSIQIYLHRIGADKEILMVGQVNANMKISNESGLKNEKIYVIPLNKIENYPLKKWFSIIDKEIRATLNLAYEFNNLKTDLLESSLAFCVGQTNILICSFALALGVHIEFINPDEENIYEDDDFITLKRRE